MSLRNPDMPRVNIPFNLPELVKSAFNKARKNGDLNFYPTQVTLLNINSIPVSPPPPYPIHSQPHMLTNFPSSNSASPPP